MTQIESQMILSLSLNFRLKFLTQKGAGIYEIIKVEEVAYEEPAVQNADASCAIM